MSGPTIRVLSTMALTGVLQSFVAEFERSAGVVVSPTFLPTVELLRRIRSGERSEAAILTTEGVAALAAEGVVEPGRDLARSFVGVAVAAGAPHPDLSSEGAFVAALLAAPSVAISKAGASGLFMAGLLERLGLAERMRDRLIVLERGYTASLAASGEAALAIQQVSELMVVPGVDIVGQLPTSLGGETVFAGAVFVGADPDGAQAGRALIAALADPARDRLYRQCGLEPVSTTRA